MCCQGAAVQPELVAAESVLPGGAVQHGLPGGGGWLLIRQLSL